MTLSERAIWQIWDKGQIVPGNDPLMWRKDQYGAWIFRRDYKNDFSEYGWEIVCANPKMDKTDDIWNLAPMNCKNTKKSDNLRPNSHVTAQGIHNYIVQ